MAQPTQTDPQFKLRLTADLKSRILEAARTNNRSMNAEIIAALEETYPAPTEDEDLIKGLEGALRFLTTTNPEQRQKMRNQLDQILAENAKKSRSKRSP